MKTADLVQKRNRKNRAKELTIKAADQGYLFFSLAGWAVVHRCCAPLRAADRFWWPACVLHWIVHCTCTAGTDCSPATHRAAYLPLLPPSLGSRARVRLGTPTGLARGSRRLARCLRVPRGRQMVFARCEHHWHPPTPLHSTPAPFLRGCEAQSLLLLSESVP